MLKLFIKSDESIKIIQALSPALIASAIYAILRGGLWGQKYFFTNRLPISSCRIQVG